MGRILIIALISLFLAPLAIFADQKQDKESILQELSAYADKDASILNNAIFSMGDAYLRENKLDAAIALYEKTSSMLPSNEDVLNRLGNLYNQKMNYDKAIAVYKKLASLKPDNVWYFQMLSSSFNMAGKKDEASAVWKDLIAKKSEDINVISQAVNYYGNLNDMENAIPLAEKMAKLDANNVGYMQNLAGYYVRAEKFDKAEDAYIKVRGMAKDQWLKDWANGEILNIYQKQNKLDELATRLDGELAKSPNNTDILKILGELYVKKGENDKAISMFEKAAANHPDDRNLNNRLVDLYEQYGKFNEAAAQMEKLVKIAPNEPYLSERLAGFYERANKKEDAQKTWESLISSVKNDPGIYSRYAEALYRLGDLNGAIAQLKKAQGMDAGNFNYTMRSASMLLDSGKTEEAKVAFGKIIVEAKDEMIKNEAKRRLEQIENVKAAQAAAAVKPEMTPVAPPTPMVKPMVVEAKPVPQAEKKEAPKQEEPKKKKGFSFGR